MAKSDQTLRRAVVLLRRRKPDHAKALTLIRAGHRRGVFGCAYALASWHLHGTEGVERDLKRAVALLREATAEGDSDGAVDLAICYELGMGVRKNEKRAFRLYLRAALANRKPADLAMYSLRDRYEEVGRCWYHGIGVVPDKGAARQWLAAADRAGAPAGSPGKKT